MRVTRGSSHLTLYNHSDQSNISSLSFSTIPFSFSLSFSPRKLLCSTLYQIRVSLTTTSLSFLLYYLFLFFYLYQKQPRRNIPIISTCFFSFQISEWLNIMGSISAMHFLIVHGILPKCVRI